MVFLAFASINATPINLSVVEDTVPAGSELDQGTVPGDTQEDVQKGRDEKENGKNDSVNKNNGTSFQFLSAFGDLDKTVSSMEKMETVFKDLERRIAGDLLRIGENLSLIQKLPYTSSNSTQSSAEVPEGGDRTDSNWLGWPIFGSILPLFHNLLENMKPKDTTNTTYEVRVTNGTRVEVNRTTSEDSGDGYNSFFQHEVIRVRPDQETMDQVAVRKDLDAMTSPQLEEESDEEEEDQKQDKSMEELFGSEEEPEEEENEVE